jgi:hypothetical protein
LGGLHLVHGGHTAAEELLGHRLDLGLVELVLVNEANDETLLPVGAVPAVGLRNLTVVTVTTSRRGNVIDWTLDQYARDAYSKTPPVNPWVKATLPYPQVARGGSWDEDDVTKPRCAPRRASGAAGRSQDPQLPKSIRYPTDAQFLGFRIIRPLKTPTVEEMQGRGNSGVERD